MFNDLTKQILQPKLIVNSPSDVYEQEAVAMADRVMRMSANETMPHPQPTTGLIGKSVQRKCSKCEEEEKRKPIMRKAENGVSGMTVSSSFASSLKASKGAGSPLPGDTRNFMEHAFSADFSGVRIHDDSHSVEMSKGINAKAFTHGTDIYFNEGKYNPGSIEGKYLLGHELTHVVQQVGRIGHKRNSSSSDIQRTVVTSPIQFHSYSELRQMCVPNFISYIQQQADWFTNPALTDEQRQNIRTLLYFLNDNVAAYFSYVKIWLFDNYLNQVSGEESDENANALRTYASSASGQHIPFAVSGSPVALTTALERGKDMIKLRQSFQDYVLHDALNESQFLRLRNRNGFIDDVIKYHDTAQQKPIFQAEDAADFSSFITYNQATSRRPLRYESTPLLNKVRNFHRFEKRALDRLAINYGDHSHVKPLTLILHSGLDHNGAFHHDPNLTAVITNNNMLTLMIEGFEQLSDYQSQISILANSYGQQHGSNFLIDQVMFAGHGNAQSIQLAGTVAEDPVHSGHIKEINQGLTVRSGHDASTRSLLSEVLSFMANPANGTAGMSPHNRVVFNACLTGYNRVAQSVNNGNAATASTEIQSYINANPSLSTYLHNVADPSLTSVGSRASFGQVSLINASNELDIISVNDPALTSASPLTYAEQGTEPTGTLRSALESWANDRPGTIAAMQRRVINPATNWDNKLIKKAYEIILANYQNKGDSFRLITLAVDRISEMKFESSATVPNGTLRFFQGLTNDGIDADASALLDSLTTTGEWNNNAIRLALLQVWMVLDATKQADFMTKLATLNCNFSVRFVDIGFLATQTLMNTLLTGTASDQAKFRLALIGVLGNNNDPEAHNYLITQLAGSQHFPTALNITNALGGASTETAILTKLGVFSAPITGTAPQVANVHITGSTTNTIFVERINKPGRISNPFGDHVYEQPIATANVLATLNYNDSVEIIGKSGNFYAIQFLSGGIPASAFISRFSVDILEPY